MHSPLGEDIVASLPVTGPPPTYGARIEVPITRQIVTFWRPAELMPATADADSYWSVTLESPPATGDWLIVWVPQDPLTEAEGSDERLVFVPLFVEAA